MKKESKESVDKFLQEQNIHDPLSMKFLECFAQASLEDKFDAQGLIKIAIENEANANAMLQALFYLSQNGYFDVVFSMMNKLFSTESFLQGIFSFERLLPIALEKQKLVQILMNDPDKRQQFIYGYLDVPYQNVKVVEGDFAAPAAEA